jgi:hypothetical protein
MRPTFVMITALFASHTRFLKLPDEPKPRRSQANKQVGWQDGRIEAASGQQTAMYADLEYFYVNNSSCHAFSVEKKHFCRKI